MKHVDILKRNHHSDVTIKKTREQRSIGSNVNCDALIYLCCGVKSERRRCVPAIAASLLSGCKWLQGVNSKTAPLLKFPGRANRKRHYNYSLLPLQYVPPEHYSTALLRRKKEKKKKRKEKWPVKSEPHISSAASAGADRWSEVMCFHREIHTDFLT